TLTAAPVPPYLRIRTPRQQFTPDETVALDVAGYSKGDALTVEARRLTLEQLIANKGEANLGAGFRVPRNVGTLLPQNLQLPPLHRDDEGAIRQKLPLRLEPGLYSIWVAVGSGQGSGERSG